MLLLLPDLPHAMGAFLDHLDRANETARPKQTKEFLAKIREAPG
jgi:hypothetical protein